MSHLRVFDPDFQDVDFSDEPEIVPFRPISRRFGGNDFDVLQRSRIIHDNRRCKCCHHPVVRPVELRDAMLNRNGMPIPGTATLVGFHCERCENEWPASDG